MVQFQTLNMWALVLAGGDGTRLQPLTRDLTGDERPKQFCALLGRETLLEETLKRVSLLVPPERTVVAVTAAHKRFYVPLRDRAPVDRWAVQPENRGTAPAILYGLLEILRLSPEAMVAIFPSDHFIAAPSRFMDSVAVASRVAARTPGKLALLGIVPEGPETSYGWIEPEYSKRGPEASFAVQGFWEKPEEPVAQLLWNRGCLWNSFVMVSSGATLLALTKAALPQLYAEFVRCPSGEGSGGDAFGQLYRSMDLTNFSAQVLAPNARDLVVVPVCGTGWTDLGEPERVLAIRRKLGMDTSWSVGETVRYRERNSLSFSLIQATLRSKAIA